MKKLHGRSHQEQECYQGDVSRGPYDILPRLTIWKPGWKANFPRSRSCEFCLFAYLVILVRQLVVPTRPQGRSVPCN